MMGHNIGFEGVIWKMVPKLSLLPLLIWSTDYSEEYMDGGLVVLWTFQ